MKWLLLLLFFGHSACAAERTIRKAASSAELAKAIEAAQPGDIVQLAPGTYEQPLQIKKRGTKEQSIKIVSSESGKTIFKVKGQAARIEGAFLSIHDIVFDSQYTDCTGVYVRGSNIKLVDCEILRAGSIDGERGGDGIQFHDSRDCVIERCHIHHCLASKAGERVDSHGVRFTNSQYMTILGSKIEMISGDCLQVDPNREPWNHITVRDCTLIGGKVAKDDPLAHPRFAAGTSTAENAIDTKCPKQGRPLITISNCLVSGFRGPIGNAAAFNIKESCSARIDRCTISDSVIGLRLRGPAEVTVTNCVLFDNDTHCRYEDNIPKLHLLHCTFGAFTGNGRGHFQEQKPSHDLRVQGCLFLDVKPKQADDASNAAIAATGFVNLEKHDYRLAKPLPLAAGSSAAADKSLQVDRAGKPRAAKTPVDVGAFQYQQP